MPDNSECTETDTVTVWIHPPITPFRLAFIFTTLGFGIAKAVLVSTGDSTSSTTIDWVAGVLIALIFQFLGSYEYSTARSQKLDWFYDYDILSTKPSTQSLDASTCEAPITEIGELLNSELPPLVTAYRLVVSCTFASFGLTKMLVGYLGFSSTMNTLEWIVAIPLTLGIYYIGLYEEHQRDSEGLKKLFDVSYHSQTTRAFTIALYLCSIALCGFWIKLWSGGVRFMMERIYDAAAHSHNPSAPWWDFAAWNPMFERSLDWTGVTLCVIMLQIGVIILAAIIWPLTEPYMGRHTRSMIFYADLVAYIILYLLLAIFWAGIFFWVLSVVVPTIALSFRPYSEVGLSMPMRMAIPLLMMGGIPLAGTPCLICLFKVFKLLKKLTKSIMHRLGD